MITAANDKRILMIYTGGTIGMQLSASGYLPVTGYLAEIMQTLPSLTDPRMPTYDLLEYDPLLDSSNMTAENWQQIALDIQRYDADYDGFVVLHGTDTMAYTASALSFLLAGLQKPVILTGAQVPIAELHSDAMNNLIGSLYFAANFTIPEVCICFHGHLYRGNRSRKLHAMNFGAFDSPNYPELGYIGTEFILYPERLLPVDSSATLSVTPWTRRPNILTVTLSPDMPIELFNLIPTEQLDALILQTYGSGNAPDKNPAFLKALEKSVADEILIVNITQCMQGSVNMDQYATNKPLRAAGVLNGADMTPEAAFTKLFYLLNQPLSFSERRQCVERNLKGELTPPKHPI